MKILPRILLHLVITLSLLAAACLGFALQRDAVIEMQRILVQGREDFQDMEGLRSRFESLNISWKAMPAIPALVEAGKGKRGATMLDLNGESDDDEKVRDQVTRDVAEAETLYAHLRASLESNASSDHRGTRPITLPLLDALFGKPKGAVANIRGSVPPLARFTGDSGKKPDAIDRPLRAGMDPWSEAHAVAVRAEMDQVYDQLDASWKRDREMASDKAGRAQFLGLASLAITAPLTLFSSLLLIRAIRKPLQRLMSATEDVAAGRFDIDLPASGKDEISRLARAFNKMSVELARARKREADFLSVAAHELKTPLTLIRVFAGRVRSLLRPGSDQAEANAHLERIDAEVDHLSRKVLDLLDLGVIAAGQLVLELHDLPARGFLTMAAGAFRPVAVEKKIQYEVSIEPGVPSLKFDPDRMNQVLLNLLDNAFKFTPPGGRVRFSARVVRGSLEIEVSDTGPGIPPELLREIFEKYARARGAPGKRRPQGTGLGLAVARGIVTAHGGTIEASSAPEKGSSFIVRLPIRAVGRGEEVA